MSSQLARLFQSTPPHGGRPTSSFNPRPRTGGTPTAEAEGVSVSIHAPARGATRRTLRSGPAEWEKFQSTPPHGGRLRHRFEIHAPHGGRRVKIWRSVGLFQSTPPHGGRPGGRAPGPDESVSFNPRPRTGGDDVNSPRPTCRRSFNPRPRTGGDCPWDGHPRRQLTRRFQSTPPHGGRPSSWRIADFPAPEEGFNPRPRTGGDCARAFSLLASSTRCKFQSTPPHGGRPVKGGQPGGTRL